MSIRHRTFSNDLKAKDLCYTDEFFSLKGEKIIPSDSFSFNSYQALKDVNDFKTNNYSNLFLTKKQKTSNWLVSKVKQQDNLNGIATTLSWYTFMDGNGEQLGSWLYFSKNYQMFDIHVSSVDCKVTYGKSQQNPNYIFYIQFIDQTTCRISHTFGDLVFYLTVQDDKTIHFSKYKNGDNQVFIYNIDNGILKLYKKVNHKILNVVDEVTGSYNKLYLLGIKRDIATKQASLMLYEDVTDSSSQTMIYIHETQLMFDYYIDGSWISYNRNKFISSIEKRKSAFNLQTQALIHHEYNRDDGFNFIPLKNNLTYKGNSVRGNNTIMSGANYPDVDYRTYNTINSGIKQERGTDNIILSYTFVDQEYDVFQGQDLIFTIPQKNQESNYLQPLWPYKFINLNDTKFIKNGAFGSNVPFFADKVKKLQNNKSELYGEQKKQISVNNETYLCSWLYKPNHQHQPIWLDRYYYPDMISRQKALKSDSTYDVSFENMIDKNYLSNDYDNNQFIRKSIHSKTYFDKKSDMIIQPGCTYRYQRVSNDAIDQINQKMNDYSIQVGYNQSNKMVSLGQFLQFNNENYIQINHSDFKRTNMLNLNGDFYLQRNKRMGIQLFGTDYKNGFNIQNRKDVVPFHYYATDKVLYLCNNKMQIVHQFDLFSKYEDYILKLILGDVFDDVIIISGIWMYILSFDLRLKTRISMIAKQDQLNAIKNLDEIVMNEFEFQRLVNYPYNDTGVDLYVYNQTDYQPDQITISDFQGSCSLEEKLISVDGVLINQDVVYQGFVEMPCNLCQVLCKQNASIYKNNVYIPVNQNIVKIIMCPDKQEDFIYFTQEDRENYPASARVLGMNQYYLNYIKSNNAHGELERVGVQQGFIQVQNIIKHIYFDEDGSIYGLNYDDYGVAADGDTIYGLYSNQKYVYSGGWWWIFNQSLSKMKVQANTAKYAEFSSPNSIDRIRFNEKGEMCLIRNFNNITDNKNPDNNKRLDVYDKTKSLIYTYDLSGYQEVISLDAFNYIDEAHEEETCFLLLCKSFNSIYKVMFLSNKKKIVTKHVGFQPNVCKNFYQTTNTNSLLRYRNYNCLYFNLHIPSHYTYDYIATIKWNLDDIQDGWYNINVKVDLEKAIFEVRINDQLHQVINESTHDWFRPYQNSDGNIFTTNYYVGAIGKKYGTTLNSLLKNSPYDPYTCKNLMMQNLILHNKSLDYYEYLAMRLRKTKINKMILTLPCGNRSNIDQMIRYFKYNPTPAMSNNVKINISGTGLSTTGEFDLLRKQIMEALHNNTDCLMNVKEIEFIQNE